MGGEIVCSQTHLRISGLWKSWTSLLQLVTNDAKLDSPPSFNAPPLASLPRIESYSWPATLESNPPHDQSQVSWVSPLLIRAVILEGLSTCYGPKKQEFSLISFPLPYCWGFSWFTSFRLKQNRQCLCMILNFHAPGWISHACSLRLLSGIFALSTYPLPLTPCQIC